MIPLALTTLPAHLWVLPPGEPWLDLGFAEACSRAREEKRIVCIDVYATWCGPCKTMDRTTWTDPAVVAWLGAMAVPLRIDGERQPELAARYKVRAFPTILFLKPDGTELGRMVGYRAAAPFLAEARDLLQGKDAVARAREKAREGNGLDPGARLRLGRALAERGRNQEALAEFLWCFDHGLEQDPAFTGVRLSFLLNDIATLGKVFPLARQALQERQARARRNIWAGQGSAAEVREFEALSRYLEEPGATFALYEELGRREGGATSPQRQAFSGIVLEPLMAARRYAEVLELAGPAHEGIEKAFQTYQRMTEGMTGLDPETRAEVIDGARKRLLKTVGSYYEALLGSASGSEAAALEVRILDFDRSSATVEALALHAERAGAREVAQALRHRGGGRTSAGLQPGKDVPPGRPRP